MNITCPNCALTFPIIAGANDADARKLAAVMGELPPIVSRPLLDYLQLFKPAKGGLRWARALAITQDLAPEIIAHQVKRDGRTLTATAELWAESLRQMADKRDKLTLPLKSNGYLREIVFGLADKAAAEAERSHEEQLRQHRDSSRQKSQAHTPTATQIRGEIRGLEELLEHAPPAAKTSMERQIANLRAKLKQMENS